MKRTAESAQKAKIGDICEIETPSGLAHVQYTHDHPSLGQLVRVLPGLYSNRPDIKKLAQEKELYFVIYILSYALRDGQTRVVSNEPVPAWARPFPIMRKPAGDRGWLIGDGSKQSTIKEIRRLTYVEQLTPEQKKLSIGEVLYPHPALVKQLARGWTPEHDEEFLQQDRAAAEARAKAQPVEPNESTPSVLDHYLYFPSKANAERVSKRLQAKGWTVEVRKGADGENWLVLAKQPAPIDEDIEKVREELEGLAEEFAGEYDGWGAPV